MTGFVTAVRAEPELVSWLQGGTWRKGFDRGSLTRATAYANTRNIRITTSGRVPGDRVFCEAEVSGTSSKPYRTRMEFFSTGRSWAAEADCSCPVGLWCKHGAAVLLLLLESLPGGVSRALVPMPKPAPAPVLLDHRLSDWLEQIGKASGTSQAAAKPAAPEKRFLAFCLEPQRYYHAPDTWHFALRVANRNKDGTFTITDTSAQADLSRPPKYLVRDDFVVVSLYHQRKRKFAVWDDMKLKEGEWEELLVAAALTGRFFAQAEDDVSWIPVTHGPEVRVLTSWEIHPDGGARPVLEFADAIPRTILPTLPPRYLDRATGALGLLAGDVPAALLSSWIGGPPIPAAQISLVASKLRQLAPALPPPAEIETVIHPAVRRSRI